MSQHPSRTEINVAALVNFKEYHGLSLRDLARWTGISRSSVERLLKGSHSAAQLAEAKPALLDGLTALLQTGDFDATQIHHSLSLIFPSEVLTLMNTNRTLLPRHVQQHFGLNRDPFAADPQRRNEVFTNKKLDQIADQVMDAILYQGFMAVIGEIGSGKTLLKKRVVEEAAHNTTPIKLVFPFFFEMERVTSRSIAGLLLEQLGQSVPYDSIRRANRLQEALGNMYTEGQRVALVIDECHHLNSRTLTALKNFWEMGSGGFTRYLGLVLFGQPQFEGRLREPKYRELFERIEIVNMPALGKAAFDYVAHRCRVAGAKPEELFDAAVITELSKQTTTPQGLGNLCNQALLKTFNLGQSKATLELLRLKATGGEPELLHVKAAKGGQ